MAESNFLQVYIEIQRNELKILLTFISRNRRLFPQLRSHHIPTMYDKERREELPMMIPCAPR